MIICHIYKAGVDNATWDLYNHVWHVGVAPYLFYEVTDWLI